MSSAALCSPLPIPCPNPANRVSHGKGKLLVAHLAIGKPAVILFPSRLVGELVEVLGANMVVLAHDHPAKAG